MIFVITLGFGPSRILRESIKRNKETVTLSKMSYRHIYFDQHYPLEKEKNSGECKEICREYGLEYIDAGKNYGLHHGFNRALELLSPGENDTIIAYDGDSYPNESGWDSALIEAIEKNSFLGWASLMNPRCKSDLEMNGYSEVKLRGGLDAWISKKPVTNSVCAWPYSFLKKTNGLTEDRPWYGHLEAPMWHKLKELYLSWAFLKDFTENDHLHFMHDEDYRTYKWLHAAMYSWDGDFESWLDAGKPGGGLLKK